MSLRVYALEFMLCTRINLATMVILRCFNFGFRIRDWMNYCSDESNLERKLAVNKKRKNYRIFDFKGKTNVFVSVA